MKTLHELIEDVVVSGISVTVRPVAPAKGPVFTREGAIILNQWHVEGNHPDFDDDRMIAVLFHELGHVKEHAAHPMSAGERRTPKNIEESEFWALRNTLEETSKLCRDGQPSPLRTALRFIKQRKESGREAPPYQNAIDRIAGSDLWASCEAMIENVA